MRLSTPLHFLLPLFRAFWFTYNRCQARYHVPFQHPHTTGCATFCFTQGTLPQTIVEQWRPRPAYAPLSPQQELPCAPLPNPHHVLVSKFISSKIIFKFSFICSNITSFQIAVPDVLHLTHKPAAEFRSVCPYRHISSSNSFMVFVLCAAIDYTHAQ